MTTETGQRERLMGRRRPSKSYPLLVDGDNVAAARAELARTQDIERQFRIKAVGGEEPSAALAAAVADVERAEAVVDGCFERIVLRAIEPARVEALIAEHPPTAEQLAQAGQARELARQRGEKALPEIPAWNEDAYRPAMLAECCENGMTVEDWSEFLARNVSNGELVGLWRLVLEVNHRERVADSVVVPKGLMEMLSSLSS